ncbi:MAG: flagellar basal body P-ring formation chaperone FlgA [Smithellaceae bacterium]
MTKIFKNIGWAFLLATCLVAVSGQSALSAQEKTKQDQAGVMQAVRQHIENHAHWAPDTMRIEFLPPMPVLAGLQGQVSFRVESKPREEYIGETSFKLRILQNNVFVKEENIRVRIEVLHDFIVSASSLGRGAVLSANDVSLQQKWVRAIPMNSVNSMDDAVGKSLNAIVRPGSRITRSMLKDIFPVQRGKRVQVVLDNGIMTMVMNGLAEEDGAEDAMIRVRNLSSNKIIYARVVGQGTVRIDF